MPRYSFIVLGLVGVAVLGATVCSCSSSKGLSSANAASEPTEFVTAADLAASDRALIDQAQGDPRARLIKSEAEFTIQTAHQDSLHRQLAGRAKILGGYVVESSKQRTEVRIPAAELDGLLEEMETWGKVSSRVVKGADVTDSFRDLRLEIDNAAERKTRLLALLAETSDVSEKLKIEAELERVSLEIDRLTAQLAELRHELKFATVTLNTAKPDKDWNPGYVLEGLGVVLKGIRSLLVVR